MDKIVKGNPAVKLMGHVENMGALIRQCDVTLLDYSPDFYRFSGSGIAWESLASGVPVLAPKGTATSRTLRAFDAGATFSATDQRAKFRVLEEMKRNYEQHLQRALVAQGKFRAKHGTSQFVDLMLGKPKL
jgi:hypothetical protein